MCRPHDGPHGAPPVPQYVSAQQDDPIAEDAPPDDQRWRDVVSFVLIEMMIPLKIFFSALDVACGADID
jgi:hypothetical protein